MTFADMQNLVLFRLRQRGQNLVSSSSSPTNGVTDYDPPYLVSLALNTAYNEFLTATQEVMPATLFVPVSTVANTNRLHITPVPPTIAAAPGNALASNPYPWGGTNYTNPYALRVYEASYIQNVAGSPVLGSERYIPIVSSRKFRSITAGYLQRVGTYSAFPKALCQLFNEGNLEAWPGFGTSGDTLLLKICPDPQATDAFYGSTVAYPCAYGGVMSLPTDVPLIRPQFHMALVNHALVTLAAAADKMGLMQAAQAAYDAKVQECLDFHMSNGEGESEQRVEDPWVGVYDDATVY